MSGWVDAAGGNTLVTAATLRLMVEWLKAVVGGKCASVPTCRLFYSQSALKRSGFQSKKIPDVGCRGRLGGMRAKGQSSAASPCARRDESLTNNVEEV